MSLDALIILAGALVSLLAYPGGFPPHIYRPLFFILGIVVITFGIVVRRQRGERETRERRRAQESTQQAYPASHEEGEMAQK
jgi:type III secretory pathway component EscV